VEKFVWYLVKEKYESTLLSLHNRSRILKAFTQTLLCSWRQIREETIEDLGKVEVMCYLLWLIWWKTFEL